MGLSFPLRCAALLAAGALVVHQARYALAPAADGAAGHAYLPLAGSAVVAALALATGGLLAGLARRDPGRCLPLAPAWAAAGAGVLVVHLGQEAVEGLLAAGHAGALAPGAWLALPLALAAGGVVALLLGGAEAALRRAARRSRPALPRPRRGPWRPGRGFCPRPLDALAALGAERAPPRPSVS